MSIFYDIQIPVLQVHRNVQVVATGICSDDIIHDWMSLLRCIQEEKYQVQQRIIVDKGGILIQVLKRMKSCTVQQAICKTQL